MILDVHVLGESYLYITMATYYIDMYICTYYTSMGYNYVMPSQHFITMVTVSVFHLFSIDN